MPLEWDSTCEYVFHSNPSAFSKFCSEPKRNIGRIIFHSLKKFDGDKHRNLTPAHARQVAGRAGRYGKKHSKGFVTTYVLKQQLMQYLNYEIVSCILSTFRFQKNDFRLFQSLLRSEVASTEVIVLL